MMNRKAAMRRKARKWRRGARRKASVVKVENRGAPYKVKWGAVDWDMQDAQIARLFLCSRERVRQKRKELGVGQSKLWHKRPGCAKDVLEGMSTECMRLGDIALKAGCRPAYALMVLLRAGKSYLRHDRRAPLKWEWWLADWSMTDKDVARKLGIPNHNVVSQYRFRHGIFKRGPKAGVAVGVKVNYPRLKS